MAVIRNQNSKRKEAVEMDNLSPERRSWLMSRVRGTDTKPEVAVRRALHGMGLRFRLHARDLPGTPDIVVPRWNVVIFVHGCFWHRHPRCRRATMPATNREFWELKFAANKERDLRNRRKLRSGGWTVLTIWECQTIDAASLVQKLENTFSG